MPKKYTIKRRIFGDDYLEDEEGNIIKLKRPLFGDPYYEIDGKKFSPKECGKILEEQTLWGGERYRKREGIFSEYYEKEGCFITTACVEHAGLSDDCTELQTMRNFRDKYIRFLPNGNKLIEEYYRTAPLIIQSIKAESNPDAVFNNLLAKLRSTVALIQAGYNSEAFAICKREFQMLKDKYGF